MMPAKRKTIPSLVAFIVFMGMPVSPALADSVTLINGDHFTGHFIEREGKRLIFKTKYAGRIKVRWEHVQSLEIDKPALLLFDNGETKSVTSVEVKEQEVIYRDSGDKELHSLQASEIVGISPEAWMNNEDGVWTGRVNLAVKTERGNGDENFVDFDADATFRRKIDRFRVSAELENDTKLKGKTGKEVTTKDKWLLRGSYNYFFKEQYYLGANMSFEQDALADLNLRTTIGPIVGYQFFESKPLNLFTEVGLLLVKEDYDGVDDKRFVHPAWHVNFDAYLIRNRLQFYHEQYGVMTLSDEENWFFKSWTGFRVPFSNGIQASAEYKLEYDNTPILDTDHTETTFRLKFGYKW